MFSEQVAFHEPSNFWIGPRPADLIELGAKFGGCMRSDPGIAKAIDAGRKLENESGCCVRNDGSGCMQTQRKECSPLLSTFHKWKRTQKGPDLRTRGPVCGQDPDYCDSPSSQPPHVWPNDLRRWPICKSQSDLSFGAPDYMTCKVTAKPCCIGIHGML